MKTTVSYTYLIEKCIMLFSEIFYFIIGVLTMNLVTNEDKILFVSFPSRLKELKFKVMQYICRNLHTILSHLSLKYCKIVWPSASALIIFYDCDNILSVWYKKISIFILFSFQCVVVKFGFVLLECVSQSRENSS